MRYSTPTMLAESAGHLTHIEDVILYHGAKGAMDAIESLGAIIDSLSGKSRANDIDVNLKFDGAPAVFCGIDPDDGEFFVAKKSLFNKVPKVYKTHQDIDDDTSGDLNAKLHVALDRFAELGIRNVLHGDFLFTKSDLKVKTIDGVAMVTFQPNTIVYAVPIDSPMGKDILAAEVGVVWHTTYSGPSLAELKPGPTADIDYLKKSSKIWMQQAHIKDLSGEILLTPEQVKQFKKDLKDAEKIVKQIGKNTLDVLMKNPKFASTLETYNNSKVRQGEFINDPTKHIKGLLDWFEAKFQKDYESKKSERGKKSAMERRDKIMEFFSSENRKNLILIYELQKKLVDIKLEVMKHMNDVSKIKTLVRTTNGFEYVGHEGFVVYDKAHGGSMLKLVDRLEFSHNNFSPDILKAWH